MQTARTHGYASEQASSSISRRAVITGAGAAIAAGATAGIIAQAKDAASSSSDATAGGTSKRGSATRTFSSQQETGFATLEITCDFDDGSLAAVSVKGVKTSKFDYYPLVKDAIDAYAASLVDAAHVEDVDVVSGASLCSLAVRRGVQSCKAQAAGLEEPQPLNPQSDDYDTATTDYAAIFSPIKVGSLTLRNRIVKSAGSGPWGGDGTAIPQSALDLYGRMADGGVAMIAVCLFAFDLAVVALLRIAPQTHGMTEEILMHAAEMLLAAVLLLAGAVMRRPVRFALLWGCAFVMITSALLSVCLGLEALTLTLAKMSTGFLAIVIWLVAIDFAHHERMSPVAIVAVLRAAASVPSVALYLLQPLLPSAWNAPAVAATLMWLLSIATLYFVTERELIALRLFEGLDAVAPVQPGVADIEHRCAEVAARFGLTERKRQIMAMTCLGKSKAYIAGQIGISESTVKSHVRNIYAKLDVHSKNELQEFVGL